MLTLSVKLNIKTLTESQTPSTDLITGVLYHFITIKYTYGSIWLYPCLNHSCSLTTSTSTFVHVHTTTRHINMWPSRACHSTGCKTWFSFLLSRLLSNLIQLETATVMLYSYRNNKSTSAQSHVIVSVKSFYKSKLGQVVQNKQHH